MNYNYLEHVMKVISTNESQIKIMERMQELLYARYKYIDCDSIGT